MHKIYEKLQHFFLATKAGFVKKKHEDWGGHSNTFQIDPQSFGMLCGGMNLPGGIHSYIYGRQNILLEDVGKISMLLKIHML